MTLKVVVVVCSRASAICSNEHNHDIIFRVDVVASCAFSKHQLCNIRQRCAGLPGFSKQLAGHKHSILVAKALPKDACGKYDKVTFLQDSALDTHLAG